LADSLIRLSTVLVWQEMTNHRLIVVLLLLARSAAAEPSPPDAGVSIAPQPPVIVAESRDASLSRVKQLPELLHLKALRFVLRPDATGMTTCSGSFFECLRWVRVERLERGRFHSWRVFAVDPRKGTIFSADREPSPGAPWPKLEPLPTRVTH
jgi:hypothetical protein